MFINIRASALLTVLAGASMLVVACGGDAATATPAPPASTPTSASPTATPTEAPTATPVPAPTATATLVPTRTPTLAPTNTPTPAGTPTSTPAPRPTVTPTAPPAPGAPIETTLTPSQDGTIWQGEGNLASGAGTQLFAGNTNNGEARRALIKFDLAGIPAGSTIASAEAKIFINRSPRDGGSPATFKLHRLEADWGTAASVASGQGGRGGPATDGDVTWTHRSRNATRWSVDGGDFVATATAETTSGTWSSSDSLVADVQAWLDAPESNHGWIVIGVEAGDGTARRFSSSEGSSPPILTIVFVTGG